MVFSVAVLHKSHIKTSSSLPFFFFFFFFNLVTMNTLTSTRCDTKWSLLHKLFLVQVSGAKNFFFEGNWVLGTDSWYNGVGAIWKDNH